MLLFLIGIVFLRYVEMLNCNETLADKRRRMVISSSRTLQSISKVDQTTIQQPYHGPTPTTSSTTSPRWHVSITRMSLSTLPNLQLTKNQTIRLPNPLPKQHHAPQDPHKNIPYNFSRAPPNNIPNLRHASPFRPIMFTHLSHILDPCLPSSHPLLHPYIRSAVYSFV